MMGNNGDRRKLLPIECDGGIYSLVETFVLMVSLRSMS